MRDKQSTGAVDPNRDHHYIDGKMVPVTEKSPTRVQKQRASKRNTGAGKGKGVEATPDPKK